MKANTQINNPNNRQPQFADINVGYKRTFKLGKLSIGLVVPLANYATSPVADMSKQIERIQLADSLGCPRYGYVKYRLTYRHLVMQARCLIRLST